MLFLPPVHVVGVKGVNKITKNKQLTCTQLQSCGLGSVLHV
jgi:hypothetical protein